MNMRIGGRVGGVPVVDRYSPKVDKDKETQVKNLVQGKEKDEDVVWQRLHVPVLPI